MMKQITWVMGAALVLAGCGGHGESNPTAPGDAQATEDAVMIGVIDAPPSELGADISPDHSPDRPITDGPPDTADSPASTDAADARASEDGGVIDGRTEAGTDAGGADVAAEAGPPGNPLCSTADSRGFFGSCSVCARPDDCDQITVGGRTRSACGCSTVACPCGLRCGCSDIAPGVRVCNICVR